MKKYLKLIIMIFLIGISDTPGFTKGNKNMISFNDSVQKEFSSNQMDSLKLDGFLGSKLNLSIINSIMAQNVDELVSPFKYRNETQLWQTEFWGKWITSAIQAYQYNKNPKLLGKIDKAVDGLIATQTADGYIGNYAPDAHLEQWDIWGRKYCLLGLIAYYDLNPNDHKKALQAANRLADHLLTEVGPGKANIVLKGNYKGLASSSILEPMVMLYKRTNEKRYLDFAKYIVNQWETSQGPQLVSKALADVPVYERFVYDTSTPWTTNGQKAYEMMSCYEGLLELYTLEEKPEYLKAVENTVKSIIRDEINLVGSGSAYECWFHGKNFQTEAVIHADEVCVTTTWIKLCSKLFMITGNPEYVDQIEKSMYNALIAGITPDGHTFTKYPPLEGVRQLSGGQCGMEMNCCGANGPRALTLYPQLMYTKNKEGLFVNFYEDSKTVFHTATNNLVHINQTGNFPVEGNLEISVDPAHKETFTIGVRIPVWSKRTLLKVNDLAYEVGPGKYVRLVREWKSGDRITLELDMRGRVVKESGHFAIVRGPIVLARDARFNNENVLGTAFLPLSVDGFVNLEKNPEESEGSMMSFLLPLSIGANTEEQYFEPKKITLCDYASAGNTWDKSSEFSVWMRMPYNARSKD